MKIISNKTWKELEELRKFKAEARIIPEEATDLKKILEKITDKLWSGKDGQFLMSSGSGWSWADPMKDPYNIQMKVGESVATYVEDVINKGVIVKQVSTPCLIVSKTGKVVKEGFTTKKPDKGYKYVLIRE